MDPRGIRYNGFSPLGSIDWRLRQHEKSLTIDKWKKYRLTDDQIKKLQETKEKLFKILEKNEKKNLRFARGREVYQSKNGSFRSRFDKDAWGSGRVYESDVFKPKSTEEIKTSLKDYTPQQLIQLGMNKNIEEPILWAFEENTEFNEQIYKKLFLWAINNNKAKVLKKLLNLFKFKEQNLEYALEKTDLNTSKVILDYGIKPTNDALNQTILKDDDDKVKLFLQYPELDPTLENNIALSFAMFRSKNNSIIKLLLNDSRIRATLESETLKILDQKYNVPVKENLLYINKIKQ
ncbi:MAG: hypothetical protein GYA51_12695 [Candidatus Methanofastidiosa archaeon]|nr:hypothetical protein [Candidatus Methanofastidiosa archaeon]